MKHILFILTFLFSFEALAQSPGQVVDAQVGVINNKKYVCLDPLFAKDLLQWRIDYPKLELKIKDLEALVTLLDEQVKYYDQLQATLTQKSIELEKQITVLNEKLKSKAAWYLSPYLWMTVGIIAGAGVTIGIIFLTK